MGSVTAPDEAPATAVVLVRWPADADRRAGLLGQGTRCLWVLPVGELVPELTPGEDWVRVGTDERDVAVRLDRLAARPVTVADHPLRIEDRVAARGNRRVVLSGTETAILRRLHASAGRLVRRDALVDAAWPGERRPVRDLTDRIRTLRHHTEVLDLHIHTIRGRGYLLDPTDRSNPWSNS